MIELLQNLSALNTEISETTKLAVIENFTLAFDTTPIELPSPQALQALKGLSNIDDVGFSLNPETQAQFKDGYPKDFERLIWNTQNNKYYGNWIVYINQHTDFIAIPSNQLHCQKNVNKGRYGSLVQYNAISLVTLTPNENGFQSMSDFETTILELANQVRNNIWGSLTFTIHPVANSNGFVAQLTVSGRGVSEKAALEIWVKSVEKIIF